MAENDFKDFIVDDGTEWDILAKPHIAAKKCMLWCSFLSLIDLVLKADPQGDVDFHEEISAKLDLGILEPAKINSAVVEMCVVVDIIFTVPGQKKKLQKKKAIKWKGERNEKRRKRAKKKAKREKKREEAKKKRKAAKAKKKLEEELLMLQTTEEMATEVKEMKKARDKKRRRESGDVGENQPPKKKPKPSTTTTTTATTAIAPTPVPPPKKKIEFTFSDDEDDGNVYNILADQ